MTKDGLFSEHFIKKYGEDLIKLSKPIFGAPPLLNKKIKQKSFDAILTYWPYQAKLLTDENFEKIIDIKDILSELGIPQGMPVIGWVFKEKWGEETSEVFKNFLKASDQAKKLMLSQMKFGMMSAHS